MKYIFLLGGKDLEMQTIQSILTEQGLEFVDKELQWGAKWSDYKDEIEKYKNQNITFVGIELGGKNDRPICSVDIDHHNFNSSLPSSLEQVVAFINENKLYKKDKVYLVREQELIAANDKAYIPGMKSLHASKDEIKCIRNKDLIAQGITDENKLLAKKSIDQYNDDYYKTGFVVVKSLTPKFSAVRDLLWFEKNVKSNKKLIIYDDDSLTYYGPISQSLIEHYQNEINAGKAYFGGNETNGFFGLVKGKWHSEEIEKQIDIIKQKTNTMQEKKIYSHHVFLFPFRWKNIVNENNKDVYLSGKLQDKFSLETFEKNLIKDQESNEVKWKRAKYDITGNSDKKPINIPGNYNEYNYFYEFVREVLYDLDKNLRTTTTKNNDKLIRHFEYKPADISNANNKPLYYHILLTKDNTHFALEIDSILLNMYGTGTGILSFHLRNKQTSNPDDILKINQFGRRIYPPFFGLDDHTIITGKKDKTDKDKQIQGAKNELANAIWISDSKDCDIDIVQKDDKKYDFSDYIKDGYYKNGPFHLSQFIKDLFPYNFISTHEKEFLEYNENKKQYVFKNDEFKIYLRSATDDRMFVISWYGNDEIANRLKMIDYEHNAYVYERDDFWYKYVFVDAGFKTCQNKYFCPELIRESTYGRWAEYGSFMGFSRYSLVLLTGSWKSLQNNHATFLVRHLQTMYYKMAELILLQRATLLSFSDEITHISDLVHNNDEDQEIILEKINELYAHYIMFVNKIYFREVTAQEQGIEMYDMMQKVMRIERDVKDLDNEISELNAYAKMQYDKSESDEMKKHTLLATIFLPIMLVSGILGMNLIQNSQRTGIFDTIMSLPFFTITILGLYAFIVLLLKIDFKNTKKLQIPVFILLLFLIMILLIFYKCNF